MRIIVNGNSITELISENITHINIAPQGRDGDFNTFLNSDDNNIDLTLLDKIIGHIRRNKKMYIRLIYLIVIFFNLNGSIIFADSFNSLTLEFFGYVKIACKAIMLIGWPVEIIKCVSGGTLDQMGKVSIKYIGFGIVIRFLPDIVSKILP